jgi:hypothetical protein
MVEDNYHAIAAEIGTVRDLVSRNLARLQSEGLLKIAGREIIVPKSKHYEKNFRDRRFTKAAMTKVFAYSPFQQIL